MPCLPPMSFNLATSYILLGLLFGSAVYADQRGLPNIAMCSGRENSVIGLASSAVLKALSRILNLSSISSRNATNGGKILNEPLGAPRSAFRDEGVFE